MTTPHTSTHTHTHHATTMAGGILPRQAQLLWVHTCNTSVLFCLEDSFTWVLPGSWLLLILTFFKEYINEQNSHLMAITQSNSSNYKRTIPQKKRNKHYFFPLYNQTQALRLTATCFLSFSISQCPLNWWWWCLVVLRVGCPESYSVNHSGLELTKIHLALPPDC